MSSAGPAIVAALLLSLTANAERKLTLQDVLALARANNHSLAAARSRLEQAHATMSRALVALLPTASATGSYTHNYRDVTYASLFAHANLPPAQSGAFSAFGDITVLKGDALQGTISASVPLIAPSAWASYASARDTFHGAQGTFDVAQSEVLFSAAQAFLSLASADEWVGARQHALEIARATVASARVRLEAGTVNRQDVSRAQLALVTAEQEAREAIDARDEARRDVARALRLHEPFSIVPAELEPRGVSPDQLQKMTDGAVRSRPEVIELERLVSAAEADARAAAWQWFPTLSGFGALNGYNYAGITGDRYSWNLGLQLVWTIYDGGNRDALRRQAEAVRTERQSRLAAVQESIADEVANAAARLETRRAAVSTAKEAVALARETLDLLRTQYEAGTALELDVLQAQDALVAAETKQVQSRLELALADLTLQRSIGTFPPKE